MSYYHNLAILFEEVVQKKSNAPALIYDDKWISYSELNSLANCTARYFQSEELTIGNVVGLFSSKEPLGYASILACLKLGIIYVALDPDSPPERVRKILKDVEPQLIYEGVEPAPELSSVVHGAEYKNISARELEKKIKVFSDENLEITGEICDDYLAYIMFTSGSTGTPKGVKVAHSNVLNFIKWTSCEFNITGDERFSGLNQFFFDNFVFDFYASIFNGAALLPVSPESLSNPFAFLSSLGERLCTVWFSVPSLITYLMMIKIFDHIHLESLKKIIFGGEAFPKKHLLKVFGKYGHQCDVFNVYGPTEGTCMCSAYKLTELDVLDNNHRYVPLGHIAKNFNFQLDCSVGEQSSSGFSQGELILLGPQVAQGYTLQDRSNGFFLWTSASGFSTRKGYRTGDVVEVEHSTGRLFFIGRVDNQVKRMGYRIELGEIENCIDGDDLTNEVVVVYGDRGEDGMGRLVAFVGTVNGIDESDQLLKRVKLELPRYMWPDEIRILSELPRSPNGKLDRKKLTQMVTHEPSS